MSADCQYDRFISINYDIFHLVLHNAETPENRFFPNPLANRI